MGDGPVQYQTTAIITMRVAIIAVIAYFISNLTVIPGSNPTNYILNPNVAYLLFGIIFGEMGFLVKNGLQKAGIYGFTMLCLYSLTPNSFTSLPRRSAGYGSAAGGHPDPGRHWYRNLLGYCW